MNNKHIISFVVGFIAFIVGIYCNYKIGQEKDADSYIVSPPYLSEYKAKIIKNNFLSKGGKDNLHSLLFYYRDKGYPFNKEMIYFCIIAANRFNIDEGYYERRCYNQRCKIYNTRYVYRLSKARP